MLGESEPSAPSRPYVVSGYSGRVYERPVAGPYITFTDAVNETTIMLKWMVSCLITSHFVSLSLASHSVNLKAPLGVPGG